MQPIAIILISLSGFIVGVVSLLAYMIQRMMSNSGWDDSNITNALRLLSHVVLHPEDFGDMYYLTRDQQDAIALTFPAMTVARPFWYIDKDELSEVVKTRPQ